MHSTITLAPDPDVRRIHVEPAERHFVDAALHLRRYLSHLLLPSAGARVPGRLQTLAERSVRVGDIKAQRLLITYAWSGCAYPDPHPADASRRRRTLPHAGRAHRAHLAGSIVGYRWSAPDRLSIGFTPIQAGRGALIALGGRL